MSVDSPLELVRTVELVWQARQVGGIQLPSPSPATSSLLQFQQQPSSRKISMSHTACTRNDNALVKAGGKLRKFKEFHHQRVSVRQGGFPWAEEHQRETAEDVSQGQVCVFIQ